MRQVHDGVKNALSAKLALEPTLRAIRFGEFLCELSLIDEEQLLDALAAHWAGAGRIGVVIANRGYMSSEAVETQANRYHALDIVEV